MQMVVLGWLVLELTDSAFLVGLVGALQWLPMLLGAVTGLAADRFNRRVMLVWLQFFSALTCLLLGFLIITGLVQVWQIMILSLLLGVTWAIDFPCARALIPDLAGKDNILNAVAIDTSGLTFMGVIGSIAGGQFITVIGMGNSFYLLGIIYFASAFFFFLIGKTEQAPVAGDTSIAADVIEGIKYMFQNQVMLAVLIITVVMNLLIFPYRQLLPIYARDILEVGPSGLGYLTAAQGVGAFFSAVTLAFLGRVRYPGVVFQVGSFIAALLLLLFAPSTIYQLSLGSLIVFGLAIVMFGTMQSTILLNLSTEQMRGRVMGILSVTIGATSLGMMAFGAIADIIGAPLVVGISAVITAVSIVAVFFSMPELRKLR